MSPLKEFRRSFVDKIFKVLDKTIPSRAERDHGTLCFSQTGEHGTSHSITGGGADGACVTIGHAVRAARQTGPCPGPRPGC